VRGGFGYLVPSTHWRFEAGASYVKAEVTQTQDAKVMSTSGPAAGLTVAPVFLDGNNPTTFGGCGIGATTSCQLHAQLHTDYDSWLINGKVAYDARWDAFSVSPFAAFVGGSSRNRQALTQLSNQSVPAGLSSITGLYSANTALTWNDVGGRLGLDASASLTPWLTWSVCGSVGLADRMISLTGSDNAVSTIDANASAISSSTTTTAFLANVESGFAIAASPTTTLRAFAGINYDNKVPGISAPTVGTSAGINFSHESSYYAGGGLVAKF
jgi:hypothetical protein